MAKALDFRPEQVDLLAYAGDTLCFLVTVVPPDILVGGTYEAQVRDPRSSSAVLETFDVDLQPGGGSLLLTLTPQQTQVLYAREVRPRRAVTAWKGEWDLQVTSPDGAVKTLVQGAITVDMDVTRAVV